MTLEAKRRREMKIKSLIDLIFDANTFGEALNGELKSPLVATLNNEFLMLVKSTDGTIVDNGGDGHRSRGAG